MESLLLMALALPGALLAHALLSRIVKLGLWAWSPLAQGEAEACTYQRSVYCTAATDLTPVVCVAAAAGVAWGLGLVWHSVLSPWLMLAGVLGVLAALAMDLQRWERVAVSGHAVWFQRGLGHTVHQLPITNIRDVQVLESAERGFTLGHGRHNRSARLSVRTGDKRLVSLPKADAFSSLESIENMANFLRLRLEQLREAALEKAKKDQAVKPPLRQREVSRPPSPPLDARPRVQAAQSGSLPEVSPHTQVRPAVLAPAPSRPGAAPPPLMVHPVGKPSPEDAELLRALRRLRRPAVSTSDMAVQRRSKAPTRSTDYRASPRSR